MALADIINHVLPFVTGAVSGAILYVSFENFWVAHQRKAKKKN
ncbi:hypothetical protein [Spirosoma sp. 209]|nr:hypothetical protein [Spirosoma sp. 209]